MASENIDELPIVKGLLERTLPSPTPQQKDVEKEWHDRASKLVPTNLKAIEPHLGELDAHLTLRSYIVGSTLSKADLYVWGVLRGNRIAVNILKQGLMVNVTRWYHHIEESEPWVSEVVLATHASKLTIKEDAGDADTQNFAMDLPNADKGVVTRFPPEPSGYLHIGHAKAALLNDYFAHKRYKGKLILRFDDTNPQKEKQEFEDSIIEDLAMLGVQPDQTTHTSDYFQELYDYCVRMLKEGTAYADDTEKETLNHERMHGIASKRRDASVEENLAHFEQMKEGTEEGKRWFIRAKMSVDDPNKALRDPAIYRCSPQAHHRTGTKWKIYPTYDFCCPIVDHIEGVTHALRTTEYNDRDAQYQWMLKALKLPHIYNWNFSRLAMIRTLLSKRKLTKFVQQGVVWGWDDPRMATVRGIRRRGMTIPALQEFILKQGPSRNIVLQDWTTFWATNKKHIDPFAARYTAIDNTAAVAVTVTGARDKPYAADVDRHAKYALGTKKVWYSGNLLIEQADAAALEVGEEITLMNWGNAIVREIKHSVLSTIASAVTPAALTDAIGTAPPAKTVTSVALELHLQGDVKKTKKKITWLSTDQALVSVELYEFDYLITKDKLEADDEVENFLTPKTASMTPAKADCNVADLKEGDIIQFDRKGYFRVDKPFLHDKPAVFFQVPTGKMK